MVANAHALGVSFSTVYIAVYFSVTYLVWFLATGGLNQEFWALVISMVHLGTALLLLEGIRSVSSRNQVSFYLSYYFAYFMIFLMLRVPKLILFVNSLPTS